MGLLDGMKDRLGFGGKPEWQDDGYYDDQAAGGYAYDDGYGALDDDDYTPPSGDVVSFDAYNPNTFKNISFDSAREPQVAGYGDGGYSSVGRRSTSATRSASRSTSSNVSSIRNRLYGDEGSADATWSAPEDPAFLDSRSSAGKSREVLESIGATHAADSANDPYSQFDSDVKQLHRNPGATLEVVTPKVYSDVEKIATAAKAGKSVVLVLNSTKSELAKRILDFSFGVASALNKNVEKASGKVFVISKGAEMLTKPEREYLAKKGILS